MNDAPDPSTSPSKPRSRLRRFAKVIGGIALLMSAGAYHISDPTFAARIRYHTAAPQTLPNGMAYAGNADPVVKQELSNKLELIRSINPRLLTNCKKVILHAPETQQETLTKGFIYFDGRAFPNGTIELCTPSLNTIVHELAHLLHNETPPEFNAQVDSILGNEYGEDLKPNYHYFINMPSFWMDGTLDARRGFVRPYGAKNRLEAVATYVESAYGENSFWAQTNVVSDDRYARMNDLLEKYGFFSKSQHATIRGNILAGSLRIAQENFARR